MPKNKAAQALARLRVKSQSPERRREIAIKAAKAANKVLSPERRKEIARMGGKASGVAKAKKKAEGDLS